ncbi:YtxH domain-containing protein [Planococcus salinus]|uniref:YtxH domain-containing protein n=1 Tax=Planococcus salinus TaxID=1848460 RepID=A0A3M8PAT6_9BACL|nr:YtxH domain-containing protein [Planococcus salinus]RNF40808.1 YtxH domain-containing protein [Planococcus salinus]
MTNNNQSNNRSDFNQSSQYGQQIPNYNEPRYNRDYYSGDAGGYQQNQYNPSSYGMSNRYDDLYDYEEESSSKDFIIGALVGGIIGAATALMLAPKSGKELMADLNTQASNLKEKTSSSSDSNEEKSSGGLTQQVKEQSNKVMDKVKNMKGGKSPMDDGTASSEGEEQIELHATVQNTTENHDKNGKEAFTSTANALKEAVEEVKDGKSGSNSNVDAKTTSNNKNSQNNSNKGNKK